MISDVRRVMAGVAVVVFLVCRAASAGTSYYVSVSSGDDAHDGLTWPTAKKSIQSAIDAAVPGATILVSNGVYYLDSEITLSKGLTLRGVGGPAGTIIDGSNACQCVLIIDAATVIDGFSIRNGFSAEHGAGVEGTPGGVLRNCYVYNNVSSNAVRSYYNPGGGIYFNGGTIEDCKVFGNSTSSGNGGGGVKLDGSATMTRCEAYGNTSVGSGGGVRAAGSATVEDCTIHDNNANYGGGINASDGSVYSRCRVYHNNPGGVWLAGGTMRGCLIYGNAAEGVYINTGGTLRNCQIYSNVSEGIILRNPGTTVENCTITGNSNGVSVVSGVFATNIFRNLILYGNGGMQYVCDSNAVFACDFSCVSPVPSNGVGNISGDPMFADATQSDFRLRAASPCIDAGTNLDWMAAATDQEGQPRIFNGRVDMGADEAAIAALGISCAGQVATVWQTVIDARNQLQYSTNLFSANWNNIGVVGTALQWQVPGIDTNSTDSSRFYRLVWLRP